MPVCHYVPQNAHLTKWPVCHKLGIKCQLGISRHSSHLVTNAILFKRNLHLSYKPKKCKIFNSSNQEIRFFYVCKQCKRIHIAKPVHDTFCLISGEIQFFSEVSWNQNSCMRSAFLWREMYIFGIQSTKTGRVTLTKIHEPPEKFNWTNQVLQLATFDNLSAVQTPPTQPQNGWNTSNGMHQET